METAFAGINLRIAVISANSSIVAVSVSVGATYVPSNTAFNAGVLAVYLNSSNSVPLQMGASPAKVKRFLCTSRKMDCSTVSCVLRSLIALHSSLT